MQIKNLFLIILTNFIFVISCDKTQQEPKITLDKTSQNSAHDNTFNIKKKSKNNTNADKNFTNYIDLIHTGTYYRTFNKFPSDLLNSNFKNCEFLEYDVPGDGNCWLWACIPVILSQILYDNKKYQNFIFKIEKLSSYVKEFGFELTNEEKQLCAQTVALLKRLKNKEGTYGELDPHKTFLKFLKKIATLLMSIQMSQNIYERLRYIKNKLLNPPKYIKKVKNFNNFINSIDRMLKNKFLFKRENLQELIIQFRDKKYKELREYIKKEDTDEIFIYLRDSCEEMLQFKNSTDMQDFEDLLNSIWGEPRYLLYFFSYFDLIMLTIIDNSQNLDIYIKKSVIDSEHKFYKDYIEKFLKNSNEPKIITIWINGNHYRYAIVKKL